MPQVGDEITPTIRLVRELGAGGMGSVWVADHRALQTQVVVKFMLAQLAADKDSLLRFSREAAAGANVKSPHVVQVLDHGIAPDGAPFIVMELLEGEDLGAHLEKRGVMPLTEVALVISQTCKALARAHERGIVHRDIKPQNIFLTNPGGDDIFVKVLDFGIAKASDLTASAASTTKTGAMMGTPYYMSPEQVIGAKGIDHRTDVWALGIVAFECLTGQKPFDAETIGGLAVSICSGLMPIPSVMNARLGVDVDRWFARACARDVAVRFSSAKEMADALNALAGGRPTEPRLSQFEESGGYPAASHPGFLPGVTPQGGVPSVGTPSALAPVRAPWDPAPVTAPVVGLGALQRTTPIPLNAAAASALARSVVEPVGKLGKLGMTTQAPVTDGEIQPAGIPSRGGTGAILALVAIAALVVVGIGVKLATRPTDAQVTTATQPTEPAAPTASTPAANASSPTVPSPAASGVSSKASVPSAPTSASVAAQKAPVAAGATSTTSTPRSSRPSIAAPMPAASPKPPPTKSKDRDSIE